MTHDNAYDQKVIYLPELVDKRARPSILKGFTFTECQINGPAVVALLPNITINGCRFEVDNVEAMCFEVPEDSPKVGVIGLTDCVFTDCSISNIAFMGTPEVLAILRGASPG
jgi:hypothetical protein